MKVNNEPKALTANDEIREVTVLTPVSLENDLSILDDLSLSSENENDIKAGCLGCAWGPPVLNHNETTMEDDEAEVISLDDLMLSEAQRNDVKAGAGCPGCGWGPPTTNHNETALEDNDAEPEAIADLPMEDDEQVKAGGAGGGGGAGKVSFQDLHFTTTVAR